jgi:hypothetical protein
MYLKQLFLILLFCTSANLANSKCLTYPDQNPQCRYPLGDVWCAKNSKNPYAFSDQCLSKVIAGHTINRDDSIYWNVVENLSCQRDPDATYLLYYLEQREIIDPSKAIKWDSMSCFPTSKLTIDGLSVKYVCASTESAATRELFPQFYWRGPGTSPGVIMSLLSDASPSEIETWWEKIDVVGSPNIELSKDNDIIGIEAVSEIRCTNWIARN